MTISPLEIDERASVVTQHASVEFLHAPNKNVRNRRWGFSTNTTFFGRARFWFDDGVVLVWS